MDLGCGDGRLVVAAAVEQQRQRDALAGLAGERAAAGQPADLGAEAPSLRGGAWPGGGGRALGVELDSAMVSAARRELGRGARELEVPRRAHIVQGDAAQLLEELLAPPPHDWMHEAEGQAAGEAAGESAGESATVITFLFLSPEGNARLEPLLRRLLPLGSRVVTASFTLPTGADAMAEEGAAVETADGGLGHGHRPREWVLEGQERVLDMEFFAFVLRGCEAGHGS
eukprot:COSAG01_NODE_1209_length_11232_cov_5.378818_2_plen_228_part_00